MGHQHVQGHNHFNEKRDENRRGLVIALAITTVHHVVGIFWRYFNE